MPFEDTEHSQTRLESSSTPPPDGNTNPSISKDPSRPKRKKARRACLACQRAHLTCGDERPCERCIKRGLQDVCHDGVRKKAKYLHDAPNEALMPGAQDIYLKAHGNNRSLEDISSNAADVTKGRENFQGNDQAVLEHSQLSTRHQSMPAGLPDEASFATYTDQEPPVTSRISPILLSPMQNVAGAPLAPSLAKSTADQPYDSTFFDPQEPAFFHFDLASMNFGNHYGALEFGMLGHLSSGANDGLRPSSHNRQSSATSYDTQNIGPSGYLEDVTDRSNFALGASGSLPDWQTNPGGHGLQMNSWNTGLGSNPDLPLRHQNRTEPNAYAIGAVSGASPGSSGTDAFLSLDRHHTDLGLLGSPPRLMFDQKSAFPQLVQPQRAPQSRDHGPSESIAKRLGNLSSVAPALRKRRRDPSTIYSSVTKPYPYTLGFHALTAVLQRRFSSQKRLLIAQALARIRPSFISCTRTLIDDDLVFMEKCFQRQLIEYEDFVSACGTPTIVCRRTGEVAYAGKEFSLLTGWSKDVLLGKAPNLNVNGHNPSGTLTANSSRTGVNTPRGPVDGSKMDGTEGPARPQPVFLAELLDDDSVIQFYEDFAKLAFADSKGSVWSPCKLLKYKTKDDMALKEALETRAANADGGDEEPPRSSGGADGHGLRRRHTKPNLLNDFVDERRSSQHILSPHTNTHRFRDRTKVDCMYCWTVRRDVFDIPMMIVINFLPLI